MNELVQNVHMSIKLQKLTTRLYTEAENLMVLWLKKIVFCMYTYLICTIHKQDSHYNLILKKYIQLYKYSKFTSTFTIIGYKLFRKI